MKKYRKTKATSRLGIAFVESVVSEAGSIFREIPEQTDIGLDGYIEFVENEMVTGTMVGVQVKTGSSFLVQRKDEQYFEVYLNREDIHYLSIQQIPVALIFYEPISKKSAWIDVTGFIRQNPNILEKKGFNFSCPTKQILFDVRAFQKEFKLTFNNYRIESDVFDLVELVASFDIEDKFLGFINLLAHPRTRFSRITCFLLRNHLFHKDDEIREQVTGSFSRYLEHPEVGYVPPQDIRQYVISLIEEFGRDETIQLLQTALLDEDNLMQRGSIGQSVMVIIYKIPMCDEYIYNIITDENENKEVRIAAMSMISEWDLYRIIERISQNFDRIVWGDVYQQATWLMEYFGKVEDIDFDLLNFVQENGYDDMQLVNLLREKSFYFLVENEDTLNCVLDNTTNMYVRFEVNRLLTRIMIWRYPPQNYMESFFPLEDVS